MHSVKPGRGPSLMNGIGGIIAALFGVFWISVANFIGAPTPFVLFGVLFVVMAVASAAYNFYNAASKDRMSAFDVTTHEGDPIARAMGHEQPPRPASTSSIASTDAAKFCPYCGTGLRAEFEFCPKCGKQVM